MSSTNVNDIDHVKPVVIDYAKHIEFLEEAVERLEEEMNKKDEQLTDANKTIAYYANHHNFIFSSVGPCTFRDMLKSEDCERVGEFLTGGSRAREYQNRWRKDDIAGQNQSPDN